jgi:uncharacterized protein (DUF1800 family)
MASLQAKINPITFEEAKHITNRLLFKAKRTYIDSLVGTNVSEVIDSLIDTAISAVPDPIDPATASTWVWTGATDNNSGTSYLRKVLRTWWTNLMIKDETILEKMVFFFHTHFTTNASDVGSRTDLIYHQLQLIRLYALGNYKAMATKMLRDCALNYYLSGFSNTKFNPNENFAREYLELFTIGKGPQVGDGDYTNYTETDIVEAAKLLSGYSFRTSRDDLDPDTGLIISYIRLNKHDVNDKTFSHAFQNTVITGGATEEDAYAEIDAFADMIFNQMATAQNIIRKIYRFFVNSTISTEVENDIIVPLASDLFNGNYELTPVLKRLFKSQHFYDLDTINPSADRKGGTISSPVELTIGLTRFFDVTIPDPAIDLEEHIQEVNNLVSYCESADMLIYDPIDVAGWSGIYQAPNYDKNWISPVSIVSRYNIVDKYIRGKKYTGGNMDLRLDIVEYVSDSANISDPSNPNILVDEIMDYVFPYEASMKRKSQFKEYLVDPEDPDYYWTSEWYLYLNGGDDSVIRPRLEAFLKAVLESPEAQVK